MYGPEEPPKRISLAWSEYQPGRVKLQVPVESPDSATPDDLAKAAMGPVRIDLKYHPEGSGFKGQGANCVGSLENLW